MMIMNMTTATTTTTTTTTTPTTASNPTSLPRAMSPISEGRLRACSQCHLEIIKSTKTNKQTSKQPTKTKLQKPATTITTTSPSQAKTTAAVMMMVVMIMMTMMTSDMKMMMKMTTATTSAPATVNNLTSFQRSTFSSPRSEPGPAR